MAPRQTGKRSNAAVAVGLVIFGAGMALFPLYYTKTGPKLFSKEGGLVGQAVIRGAYINTASKDVGLDPDFHKYKSEPIVGNGPLGPGR